MALNLRIKFKGQMNDKQGKKSKIKGLGDVLNHDKWGDKSLDL